MQADQERSSGLSREETPVAPPSEGRQPGSLSEKQDFIEVIEVGDLKSFLESLKGCPLILNLVEATLTPEQKERYSDTLRGLRQDNRRRNGK